MNFLRCVRIALIGFAVVGLSGCEEDSSDAVISQFEQPQDVALVCFDSAKGVPVPLDCCGKEVNIGESNCSFGITTANLYAFVTQTTPGEVAVVNMDERDIVDQEKTIPYNSFIPVGGQPNDIAATTDGRRVYTANLETDDVSVIHVVEEKTGDVDEKTGDSVIDKPSLSPANSIELGGPAARISLVKYPKIYEDRFAIVTQPSLARLAILSLDAADELCPEEQEDGCVIGFLRTTVTVQNPDSGEDEEVDVHPRAITSADGQSVYVGSYDSSVIIDIQVESLIREAMTLEEVGEIPADRVVNEVIDISPHTVRTLSIEKKKRRWMYAVENEKGGIIAMNLGNRIPGKMPLEIIEVEMDGLARSVKVLELEEDSDPGPFTFNGTFAVVTTTKAGLGVIDIEDNDLSIEYYLPNSMRSQIDLTDTDEGIAEIDDDPVLTVDDNSIDERVVSDYVEFIEPDGGVKGCDADAGDTDTFTFKPEMDKGIRFRCEPYQSRQQRWSIVWKGPIGLYGTGRIENINEKNPDSWMLVNEDAGKNFCELELYTSKNRDGYNGDLLIITSEPTPDEENEEMCKKMYDVDHPLAYRIVGVSKSPESEKNPNVIEFVKDGEYSLDLKPECFGQAVEFEVRAADHWIVQGNRTESKPQIGSFSPKEKSCVYKTPASELRLYEGEEYKNRYILLNMKYGENWANGPRKIEFEDGDTDTNIEASISFDVVNGYEEMFVGLGATNITDIEISPDNELFMIDKGGEGLIVFDLLNDFKTNGSHIN